MSRAPRRAPHRQLAGLAGQQLAKVEAGTTGEKDADDSAADCCDANCELLHEVSPLSVPPRRRLGSSWAQGKTRNIGQVTSSRRVVFEAQPARTTRFRGIVARPEEGSQPSRRCLEEGSRPPSRPLLQA